MDQRKQLAWIADEQGLVRRGELRPAARRPRSAQERLEAYYAGLKLVADTLERLGFSTHHRCDYSVSMECQGVLVDFRLQEPPNVAYVTSYTAGSTGQKGKHGGCIYRLQDEIKSEMCVQVILGKQVSAKPVYIELSEDLIDPARHIFEGITGLLAAVGEKKGKLKQLPFPAQQLPEWL